MQCKNKMRIFLPIRLLKSCKLGNILLWQGSREAGMSNIAEKCVNWPERCG